MKYLYYIAGILVVFSGLAAYGLVDTRVEISKPVIVVNDRIITEVEFKELLLSKPYYMDEDQYKDSLITQQLLIQEAVGQDINQEESFRKSVQNFYEQSLIKILLDRKLASLTAEATPEELEKYQQLSLSKVHISKLIYPTLEDALAGQNPTLQKIESGFDDISDDLKFIVLTLEKGESAAPLVSDMGAVVYKLEEIQPAPDSKEIREIDLNAVSLYIQDKKKEALMDQWTQMLKENAEIWRDK